MWVMDCTLEVRLCDVIKLLQHQSIMALAVLLLMIHAMNEPPLPSPRLPTPRKYYCMPYSRTFEAIIAHLKNGLRKMGFRLIIIFFAILRAGNQFLDMKPVTPAQDFNVQLRKLASGKELFKLKVSKQHCGTLVCLMIFF